MTTTRKKRATKKTMAQDALSREQESYVSKIDTTWQLSSPNMRGAALSLLLREALGGTEEDPLGNIRTVGEGLIGDVIKCARRGNAAALNIIFDRTEGKVPTSSVNVNATFTDDERVSRIISLIKRGGSGSGNSEPEPGGEDGA